MTQPCTTPSPALYTITTEVDPIEDVIMVSGMQGNRSALLFFGMFLLNHSMDLQEAVTMNLAVVTYSAACQTWNEQEMRWSEDGCRVRFAVRV